MNINIFYSSNIPIYEQIFEQIKSAIISGNYVANEMLPSIRFLAKELKISTITTKRAYDELERQGYIYSVVGRGSFVSHLDKSSQRRDDLDKIVENLQQAVELAERSGISKEEVAEILNKQWSKKGGTKV